MSDEKTEVEDHLEDMPTPPQDSDAPSEDEGKVNVDDDISDILDELDEPDWPTEPKEEPKEEPKAESEPEPEPEPEPTPEPEPEPLDGQTEPEPAEPSLEQQVRDLTAEIAKLRAEKAEGVRKEPEPEPQPTSEGRAKAREEAQQQLREVYALSQEDADTLLTNPEAVMPRLAANLHTSILESMMRIMPTFLDQWIQERESSRASEDSFYAGVEGVDPRLAEHRAVVDRFRPVFAEMNPDMPAAELAALVGQKVLAMMDLEPQAPSAPAPSRSTTPAAPPRPASLKGSGGPKAPPKEKSFFEEAAEDDLREAM